MRSYWLWFVMLFCAWFLAIYFFYKPVLAHPFILLGSALFFSIYFLLPLMQKYPKIHLTAFLVMSLISIAVFWSTNSSQPSNQFALLVYILIAGDAVHRLRARFAVIVTVLLFIGTLTPYLLYSSVANSIFIIYVTLLFAFAFIAYYQTKSNASILSEQHEALRSEFRIIKRQLLSSEKLARQDERAQIARDIHDSVGHRLTALLMQLEVAQMKSEDEQTKEQLIRLKELAKNSLEDTRSAVKTLKRDEVGGLTAIISLIRKLEAESHVRIEFSIKHGALSAPLTNDQVIVVYRSVQEALTNMMRHSDTKEAKIIFEVPANRYFRFEITNPLSEVKEISEGFGLTSMRERVDQVNGTLDIQQYNGTFCVRGMIPLVEGEIE